MGQCNIHALKVNIYWTLHGRFFNWDSLHARLNCHCKARSYKKKKKKKRLKYTGNLFSENLQLTVSVNSRLKAV